jgi:hypothetical protein
MNGPDQIVGKALELAEQCGESEQFSGVDGVVALQVASVLLALANAPDDMPRDEIVERLRNTFELSLRAGEDLAKR